MRTIGRILINAWLWFFEVPLPKPAYHEPLYIKLYKGANVRDEFPKQAGQLNTGLLMQKSKGITSEDDYVAGFIEGQKNAEFQRKLFAESLEGLINIAASRGEFNSLAYARYLLKRLGYDIAKRA